MIYFESGVGDNYPRIGWNSVTRRGTIAASSEAAGFPATNAASAWEYSYWKATATTDQTLTLTFDSSEDVDFVGISAHNLGTAGATIQVQENDGGWSDIGPAVSPSDDQPIGIILASRTLDEIRLSITGMSTEPYIGVLYVCEALTFPQRTYAAQGTPANMARKTEFMNAQSITGKYIGRSIKKQRNRVDVPLRHLTETWVAANFDPFAHDALSHPYFLCPRPGDYAKDIQYKMSASDIVPERMGVGGNLMQVTV